jgi:hypothetical protein
VNLDTRQTTTAERQEAIDQHNRQQEEKKLQREEKKQMASSFQKLLLSKSVQGAEPFSGVDDQDPSDWLDEIEAILAITNIKDDARTPIAAQCLSGDAAKWYKPAKETINGRWSTFKSELIKTFTSTTQKLNISTKLQNRRQGLNESVQSYYFDVLALCVKLDHEMKEEQKLLHLQRGLKPSLAQMTIPFNPQTCLQLLEQAKRSEVAAAMIQVPVTSATTTRTTTEEVSEEVAAMQPPLNYWRQHPLAHSQQPTTTYYPVRPPSQPSYQQYDSQYYFQEPQYSDSTGYSNRGRNRQQQQERWSRSHPPTRSFGLAYRQPRPDYYSSSTGCYSCGKPGHFARECRSGREVHYPKV